LRAESVQGISDAVSRGCIDGAEMGKRIVLPASHVAGRRYMLQNYHDSLAICRVHGPPDYFLTFTCNPAWPEIVDSLEPGQTAADRSDVIVRVYHLKLDDLLGDLRSDAIFGPLIAGTSLAYLITPSFGCHRACLPPLWMLLIFSMLNTFLKALTDSY
jgi:hypothetical protein